MIIHNLKNLFAGMVIKDYPVSVFSLGHIAFLTVSILFIILILLIGRKLGSRGRRNLLICLWISFTVIEMSRYIRYFTVPGYFDVKTSLPFHLCSISIFTYPLAIFIDNATLRNFIYAVNMPGAFFALITPDIGDESLFSFYFIHMMAAHTFIVLIPLYMVVCGSFRPNFKKLPSVTVMLLITMIPAVLLNHFLGSNYYFINGPVSGTFTETLANTVGEKFYLIPMILMVFAMWLLLYSPFIISDMYKTCKEGN